MATIRTLFDEAQIETRVGELARDIAAVLPRDVMIVGLLTGSFVFVADLVRALARHGVSPRVAFMRLSSYGSARESSRDVKLIGDVPGVAGRTVLLVDDIVDTGRTQAFARDLLLGQGAVQIVSCMLLDKPSRREVAVATDFVGFPIEDLFVVGYGIDYAEQYRHLPYIGTVD
jgi:hypoxanthine phosphoribosyltransferase